MWKRIKKFQDENEEAVFFCSTIAIGVCVGILVGWKVADSKVTHINQYLTESGETTGLEAVFKNGRSQFFRTCISE